MDEDGRKRTGRDYSAAIDGALYSVRVWHDARGKEVRRAYYVKDTNGARQVARDGYHEALEACFRLNRKEG